MLRQAPSSSSSSYILYTATIPLFVSEERHTTRINFEEPEFLAPIHNLTVPVGREAVLSCTVSNLGNYKVRWMSRPLALFAPSRVPFQVGKMPTALRSTSFCLPLALSPLRFCFQSKSKLPQQFGERI